MDSILLVDWPTTDLPESLARSGHTVLAQEGPATYVSYEVSGDAVVRSEVGEPSAVDSVYAYRPLDEVPEIVELATRLGAHSVWWETGPDAASDSDNARARSLVEDAGLEFHAGRPAGGTR